MKQEEYVKTVVFRDRCIPVGLDDSGQTYFIEYVNEQGIFVEECCGPYNTDYQGYIEYKFGDPERDCSHYKTLDNKTCEFRTQYGYCDKCKFQDIEWSTWQELIRLGIIDNRGNVLGQYNKFLSLRNKED